MEQQTIPVRNGRLTCRVRGDRAELCLETRPDRPGLYRGLLTGPKGRWDLGLLLPEGGCLRLRRTLSVSALDRAGCWPVTGAEAVLAHAFLSGAEPPPPPGWRRLRDAAPLFPGDPVLARAAAQTGGWIHRPEEEGTFSLAAPWPAGGPFPLVPVFCFARAGQMEGRRWVIYRFAAGGAPQMPNLDKSPASQ